ncbi:HAD-like domain-containing protein [Immersiella caudata]|uniref:HAD-like domain-containing protein n=1 Tax=Immersiella caudata TaxID=314043 RepID=A0AA39WLM8_9PEZI|nr:HAD-like domain-containing protein [Immersiella caudata]
MSATEFPPVRACIFDMDGLLINTEDIYKQCADNVLVRHSRPPLPWSIKAQLMGVPGSSNGDVFHEWAKLSISREQYGREQEIEQKKLFALCEPLPGAVQLLEKLTGRRVGGSSGTSANPPVEVALASSSSSQNYALKTVRSETKAFLDLIPPERRVLADDEKMKGAKGKPAPDIFLKALEAINVALPEDKKISPVECLVFEDSVPGVEAGRRAGMRVVWVPHPDLKAYFAGREGGVLAGRTGIVPIGKEEQLGEVGDSWAEEIGSLEEFEYAKYGIGVQ